MCRDDAPPSSDSSDSEGPPFPGVPEDTKEYFHQLLREKDEARQNYSQETIRSQHLAAELQVVQSNRTVVRAQLAATDSRVACKSSYSCNASFLLKSSSLTLYFSCSGVTDPDPPCRSGHRHWIGECSRRHRRRLSMGHLPPRPRGHRTRDPPGCFYGPRHCPVPVRP